MDNLPTKKFYELKALVNRLYDLTASETVDVGDYADASMHLVDDIAEIINGLKEPPWVWEIYVVDYDPREPPFLFCGTGMEAQEVCKKVGDRVGKVAVALPLCAPSEVELQEFEARTTKVAS